MRKTKILGLIALCCISNVVALAQNSPATMPAQEFAVTPIRLQEINAAETFLSGNGETTISNISSAIQKINEPLIKAIDSGKVQWRGPMIAIYHGIGMDAQKPFKIEVGYPVRSDTIAWGDYKIRKLPALRAATIVFSGPLSQLPQVYQKLYADIFAAGLMPGDEVRETYLYWEGLDSPNNIVLIQVSVNDAKVK
jgi:effector-binding domain-containing protein